MEEWKEYRLGDIITISSGFPYKGEFIGCGDNYILGMGCVSFKETFLPSGMRSYSSNSPERYLAYPGDIVLATRQQSDNMPILGMPAIIPNSCSGKNLIIGANLYKVQNNSEFSNSFLFWLLKSPAYVQHIKSCQTGSTVRMITKANIENFYFYAPQKEERNKISNFLWNIERKIELNRQINDNLEQQAQALFKSWFVDFEPFKDGEFVDSELGMIPKGWKIGTLGDIADVSSGKRPPMKQSEMTPDINIPLIGASSVMGFTNEVLYNKAILVIGRVGTHGIVQRFNTPCWPSDNTLVIETTFYEYVNQILRVIDYKSLNRGSTQPLITQTDLKNQMVLIPNEKVLCDYNEIASKAMIKFDFNLSEINHLVTIRDTLLPRLMSGELKINEINC